MSETRQTPPAPPILPRLRMGWGGGPVDPVALQHWADQLVHQVSVEFGRLQASVAVPGDGRPYVRQAGVWVPVDLAAPYDLPFDFGPGAPVASDERAVVVVRPHRIPAGLALSRGTAVAGGATALAVNLLVGAVSFGTATLSTGGAWSFAGAPGGLLVPAGSLVRVVMPGVIPAGAQGCRLTLAGESAE